MNIDKFFAGLSDIFAAGNMDQVNAYLRETLEAAEAEGDKSSIVTILNEMAGYYRSVSAYPDALAAVNIALSLLREMGLEGTVPYGTTLLNAATAYRAAGNAGEALRLFEAALGIFKAQLPAGDSRLAGLYNNLSALYQDAGDYEKAREALEHAVEIMEALPELTIDLATVYCNLALALFALKRNGEAQQRLHEAMQIFEREGTTALADARKAPHYAAALAGFATAHYTTGQFAKAVEIYTEALKRIKNCFGENRDYAITCRNCATAYEALGNAEKAEEVREKANQIMQKFELFTGK